MGNYLIPNASYIQPPSLFGGETNASYEAVIFDDLRTRISEFNLELKNEMLANQKLNRQCDDYAEKLKIISTEFESFKIRKEARIELLEQKLSNL